MPIGTRNLKNANTPDKVAQFGSNYIDFEADRESDSLRDIHGARVLRAVLRRSMGGPVGNPIKLNVSRETLEADHGETE